MSSSYKKLKLRNSFSSPKKNLLSPCFLQASTQEFPIHFSLRSRVPHILHRRLFDERDARQSEASYQWCPNKSGVGAAGRDVVAGAAGRSSRGIFRRQVSQCMRQPLLAGATGSLTLQQPAEQAPPEPVEPAFSEPMASELGNEVWRLVSAIALVALMRVLFDRAGLVLGIVYAAGFFAEQVCSEKGVCVRQSWIVVSVSREDRKPCTLDQLSPSPPGQYPSIANPCDVGEAPAGCPRGTCTAFHTGPPISPKATHKLPSTVTHAARPDSTPPPQLAKALAHKINIPPLTFMLGAGLLLRNVPGPWRQLMMEVPFFPPTDPQK